MHWTIILTEVSFYTHYLISSYKKCGSCYLKQCVQLRSASCQKLKMYNISLRVFLFYKPVIGILDVNFHKEIQQVIPFADYIQTATYLENSVLEVWVQARMRRIWHSTLLHKRQVSSASAVHFTAVIPVASSATLANTWAHQWGKFLLFEKINYEYFLEEGWMNLRCLLLAISLLSLLPNWEGEETLHLVIIWQQVIWNI